MSLGIAIPYLKRQEDLLYDAAREGSQQLEPLKQQIVDWPLVGSTFGDSYELVRTASLMVHPEDIVSKHAKNIKNDWTINIEITSYILRSNCI